MNISITFRQMDPSEAIKGYATSKISKLQKFMQQPMSAKVTLSIQKQLHVAEVQVSSGSRRVEAKESGDEMYACIDKVLDKLERQISGSKGVLVAKKRRTGLGTRGELDSEPPEPMQSDGISDPIAGSGSVRHAAEGDKAPSK